MESLALVGLGSNLGDRRVNLDSAVAALSATPGVTVLAASSYHETAPVGGPGGQGAFLNAAATLETTLQPEALLDRLNAIEDESGRVRTVRWGARPLDMDLLLFGDQVIDTPRLRVPHPRMALRRFVLAPAAEIAPDVIEPFTGRSIVALLANLDRRPSYAAIVRRGVNERPVFRRVVADLSAVGLSRGRDTRRQRVRNLPPPRRLSYYLKRLDQSANELRLDRWSEDVWGDRWVVTDSWFDEIDELASSDLPPADYLRFHDRFLKRRSSVITPTFLVLAGDSRFTTDREGPGDGAGRSGTDRFRQPALRTEGETPEGVASEILAACASTRVGSTRFPGVPPVSLGE